MELIRRRWLREEFSLLWLAAALLILFLSLFKDLTDVLTQRLGIGYASSLIAVIAIALLILNQLVLSVVISSLVRKNCNLAQKVAELEWQTNQLRKRAQEQKRQNSAVWPITAEENQSPVREEMTTPL
jgi:ABC-type uncharacterized transport system permease subunit